MGGHLRRSGRNRGSLARFHHPDCVVSQTTPACASVEECRISTAARWFGDAAFSLPASGFANAGLGVIDVPWFHERTQTREATCTHE